MMDLVTCEAPLDSSFQKDRLELVNKGSLGRRRKPSRSNLKQLLSPSRDSQPLTPSTPAQPAKEIVVNGDFYKEPHTLQNCRQQIKIESSLPRTPPEPNLVAEAQQFSIQAKLKLKKSDLGRSAVLIQTWERRTQYDSCPKQRQKAKTLAIINRFQNKENLPVVENAPAMPDSYICPKYKGGLQNGETLNKSGLVPTVRDASPTETMLYRLPENGPKVAKLPSITNGETNSSHQEPEWISLSRKLCAKFVEGHIDSHSADSYHHEEPEGVREVKKSSPPAQKKAISSDVSHTEKKKKVIEVPVPENHNEEPPWVHLSRKLCTKFIEEHIEYPPVTFDQSVEKAKFVEPNGDVRIIEKIGKPKSRKSRTRKESEPEWISLSRKLRAKFIESHIDDPDTISLENQLNASDPEETSSESLSDASQEAGIDEKDYAPVLSEYKDYETKKENEIESCMISENTYKNQHQIPFSERECCWQYQEMEFDQESSSGTFQEAEFLEETSRGDHEGEIRIRRGSIPQENSSDSPCPKGFVSFAERENSQNFQRTECYNNDVQFAPHFKSNIEPYSDRSQSEQKLITVQFIAHPERNSRAHEETEIITEAISPQKCANGSFFNLSTWEEAHYKPDDAESEANENYCQNSCLRKDVRSKSLDDIYDSKETKCFKKENNCNNRKQTQCLNSNSIVLVNGICKSEEILNKKECEINSFCGEEEKFSDKCLLPQNKSSSGENICKITAKNELRRKEYRRSESSSEEEERSNALERKLPDKETEPQHKVSSTNGTSKLDSKRIPAKRTSPKNRGYSENDVGKIMSGKLSDKRTSSVREHSPNRYSSGEEMGYDSASPSDKLSSSRNGSFSEDVRSNGSQRKIPHDCHLSPKENGNIMSNVELKNMSASNKDPNIYGKVLVNGANQEPKKIAQYHNGDISAENKLETLKNESKYKCNGVIPNSRCNNLTFDGESSSRILGKNEEIAQGNCSGRTKLGMSKWINISKSEQTLCKNEYANLKSPTEQKSCKNEVDHSERVQNGSHSKRSEFHSESAKSSNSTKPQAGPEHAKKYAAEGAIKRSNRIIPLCDFGRNVSDASDFEESPLKVKSMSLCDVSCNSNSYADYKSKNGDVNLKIFGNVPRVVVDNSNLSKGDFQEFELGAEIPLCAKLVSKQHKKRSSQKASSISSSSNRNESPSSLSSHVYEDMFKESCPSDSEASSWTVMKNNSYYINGRSSSMNDLDFSDSCSLSVKCDYASSCSDQGTLQSRRSSCGSSSFYVNLRDYDSHMLEPSLNRKKQDNRKLPSNGTSSSISKSNPPTPESLRHLFTSPLSSIHSPPSRTSRLVNRMPLDPQSHYYSSVAAASSAFKHGFDPTPPKPKKERSSSIKIKDIAHGIILTFRRFQNHSKTAHVSPTHYVDVSHLAEIGPKVGKNLDSGKSKSKKGQKESSRKSDLEKNHWSQTTENGRTDSDSGCQLPSSDVQRAKARRSSSDLTGMKTNSDVLTQDKKKSKNGKKIMSNREKGTSLSV